MTDKTYTVYRSNELVLWSDSDMQEDPVGYHLAFKAFCAVANEDAVLALVAQLRRYKAALEFIRDELGVPQPDYPAPVTNASKRARKALEE